LLNGETYLESDSRPFVMHDFLSAIYERLKIEYRRFYRMDALSKLGFLASELVLGRIDRPVAGEDTGIVLFNRSASLEADGKYQETIRDKNNFFPSPSDFVYTLPNIVTGEIAIRNRIYGETAFYILPDFRGESMYEAIESMIRFAGMKYVLAGWTEVDPFSGTPDCLMALCEAESSPTTTPLTPGLLEELY
jgi:hypothetical protein